MTVKNSNKIEKIQNPLVSRLISFGFSGAEALIYVYLLEKGKETGGSKIAIATGLHRQYVYIALPKLIEQRLVEEIPHGKQAKYKARPPHELEKIGRKKATYASDLAKDLNIISAIGNEQDFEVIQGARAIQQYEMEYVENADQFSEEFVIGGAAKDFISLMGDYLPEYLLEKKRKNLNVKYLGSLNEESLYKGQIGINENQEYRFMSKLPEGVTHMVIKNDTVSFYSFLNPPLIYVIKSQVVAQNYKQFFMMLWEMAEGK